MANLSYGSFLRMKGANFNAITLEDALELNQYKNVATIISDGKITDFIERMYEDEN